MVDLSQNQPPKQEPTQDTPVGDQPPAAQPAVPPKPDDTSLPPIKTEEKIKKELSELGIPPEGPRSKKTRILLAALGLLLLIATLPAAVYLVKQRQEIRKEAAPGEPGDMTCLSDVVIGPGSYSYAARGVGLKDTTSGTITINLPAGSIPLSDYAYAFWSGEKGGSPANPSGITINGTSLSGEKIYHKYNDDWDNTGYIYRVKIPSSLISGTSLTFNVSVTDLGPAHGVGVVILYEESSLSTSKIIIKSCGDFVYTGEHRDIDDKSDPIVFNLTDITSPGETIRAGFFFGEGEGDASRPNYFYYNGARLKPTDGTPYPAYSTDGGWWDTRITGEDLPAITAGGTTASFQARSPPGDRPARGESFYFIGGILQYPVTPPTEVLTCTNLAGAPDPSEVSPGDEITLTCTGTSDPAPIHHFEFRVASDSGAPVDLGSVEATDQGQITYTIPDYGCYKIECRACTSSDSSECTEWGQAQ